METIIDTEWGLWLLVKWEFHYHQGFAGSLEEPPEPEEIEVEIDEVFQAGKPNEAGEHPFLSSSALDTEEMDLESIYQHLEQEAWELVAERETERAEESYQNWKESRYE
jgi:hypothetical protein